MKDCNEYIELANLTVDGLLTPERQQELEEHMGACRECQMRAQAAQTLKDAFDALEAEPPEALAPAVMNKISRGGLAEFPWKRFLPYGFALAAACVVLVVVLAKQGVFSPRQADNEAAKGDEYLYMGETGKASGDIAPASGGGDSATAEPSVRDVGEDLAEGSYGSIIDSGAAPPALPNLDETAGQKIYGIMIVFEGEPPDEWSDYRRDETDTQLTVYVPSDVFDAFHEANLQYPIADEGPDLDESAEFGMVVFPR